MGPILLKWVTRMIINGCLAILITIAVIWDLKSHRIPNWIILCGLLGGFGYNLAAAGWSGGLLALKGMLLGMLFLFPAFAVGGMGAGDVKLLGMVGAMKGSLFALNTFIWTGLWGGLIAVILLAYKKALKQTAMKLTYGFMIAPMGFTKVDMTSQNNPAAVCFPYGLAIGLGVLMAFLKSWW